MSPALKYIDKRLEQLRKDKASPLIIGPGERELIWVRHVLLDEREKSIRERERKKREAEQK